ncbi:MAG: hypothetical protein Q4D37_02635 [Oscillospiraceae bacterium]|nr:hypothetical protein [Oscillospiraceae bacterium]
MDATTFPLPLPYHVVLCVLGCVFFFAQFIRLKKPYQLMMAIAMPASLLIYIQPENKILFYVVGLLIGLDMLLAVIISIVLRIRSPKKEQEADAK